MQIEAIRDRSERDEDLLGNAAREVLGPLLSLATVLGKRSKVTVPNLASLMFFIEESSGDDSAGHRGRTLAGHPERS